MFRNRCWNVAICKTNSFDINKINKYKFSIIKNGLWFWVADPFPFEVDGELYIFGEVFEYRTLKGAIGYTKKVGSHFSEWKIVIKEQFHLSFPYLFIYENSIFMCPEARDSGELFLYKCIDFPDIWEKSVVIMPEYHLVDTVFYYDKNDVYGFSCEWNNVENHNLRIFRIKNNKIDFFNNCNVMVLQKNGVRPAGKIFYDNTNNKWIAVSQDCQLIYGKGIIFKEFKLKYPYYEESELFRLYPAEINIDIKKKYDGLHTFNFSENYVVIDLSYSRFNIIEKTNRLIKKLKKLVAFI